MTSPEHDAARLLADARAGSADALGRLLEIYRGYLLRIAGQELDPDLRAKGGASDLVQETFLEAHRDFAQFHGGLDEELRAWLRQLLRHNLANFVRGFREAGKRAVEREVSLTAGDSAADRAGQLAADQSTPSAHVVREEEAQALERVLSQLPDDYREVLLLRYREGLSFEAIGQRLGRTENGARKLWARAVERVQRELEGPS
jgi:RNA polymerase sigma-70 factor (ECF subfamily)